MTLGDPRSTGRTDEAFARLGAARNADELEMAWIDGLRERRAPEDRQRILAAAGTRLGALGDLADDGLRMSWLRQVAEEAGLLDDPPPGETLSPLVSKALREAFVRAQGDLSDLRSALDSGETAIAYATHSPASAARLRDLGRIVERLRGNGLLALVSPDDTALVGNFVLELKSRSQPVPVVPDPWRVSRDQLLHWASTPDATGDLPRLIRSLIAETAPDVERIHMPVGSGVSGAGWDGIVECTNENRFVPSGLSVWELSTAQANTQSKAARDYEKRVRSIPSEDRANMTYVAVICAPWVKAPGFATDKSRQREFKKVHALNVDGLESWLECAPATTVWLRERMDHPIAGLTSLSTWWRTWLDSTRIPLDANVVLAGRGDQAKQLRKLCHRDRMGIITIGGDIPRDEILAFAAATLIEPDFNASQVRDVLYVTDTTTLKLLVASENCSRPRSTTSIGSGMTLIVPSSDIARDYPPNSIHRVIVPLPGVVRSDIVLGPVDDTIVDDTLKGAHDDHYMSHNLGAMARMSLLTLRRHLAIKPGLSEPTWSSDGICGTLRRCLLLNSWDQRNPRDREIVEQFVNMSHDEVVEFLLSIPAHDQPPLVLTESRWHVVSPTDAWELLNNHFTQQDLQDFEQTAIDVLLNSASQYSQDLAGLLAMRSGADRIPCSHALGQGVATTLALLGTHPPRLQGKVTHETSAADRIVAQLLRAANDDLARHIWISVANHLPLLAEAAPEAVTTTLRTRLAKDDHGADWLFTDVTSGGVYFPTSPHIHVLHALEILAWSPAHFDAVVNLLARMATCDPGGRLANRPANTLATIFCSWCPQTSATYKSRINALDALRSRYPSVAWKLMLTMLPTTMDTVASNPGPRYRDWKDGEPTVTSGEWSDMIAEVSTRLVDDARSDPERLAIAVECIGRLTASARSSLCAKLHKLADPDAAEELQHIVWPVLRREVAHHRQFNDAEWALPEDELAPFDDLICHLRPANPVDAYGWLFDGNILSIKGIPINDYESYRATLASAQFEAVEAVLAESGLAGVLELAKGVARPHQVGDILARTGFKYDVSLLEALNSSTESKRVSALAYFDFRFQEFDWNIFDKFLTENRPGTEVTADLLRTMPRKTKPWNKVQEYGASVECEYWGRVDQDDFGNLADKAEALVIVERLLDFKRPTPAANLLWRQVDKIESDPRSAEIISTCLEQIAEYDRERVQGFFAPDVYVLESLLRVLDSHREHVGISRVIEIESHYYPLLRRKATFSAPNIYRRMAADPEHFVALVERAYRPAGSSPNFGDKSNDVERHKTLVAYRLLRDWPRSKVSPGLDESGRLDEKLLKEWVKQARSALRAADRADIGDQMIGHALAATPAEVNGEWPSRIVRDLIERIDSDALDTGIHMALANQRGATCRGPTQGGEQERELVASYEARAKRVGAWPRVAAILRSLADAYRSEADWHDNTAEAHRRGLWS